MNQLHIHHLLGVVAVGLSLLAPELVLGEGGAERGTGGFRTRLENGDFVHVWKTPGTYEFTVPDGVTALRYLVIGGGGAGGSGGGGGGGAGAVKDGTLTLAAGTKISLTVGAGGKGHLIYGCRGENGKATTLAVNGQTAVTALGGGAGGSGLGKESAPNAGASGGGGGAPFLNVILAGGAATDGGFAGGGSSGLVDQYAGGGGGGAGTPGGDSGSCQSGNGGDGVTSDITGEDRYYGGGGGGGGCLPQNRASVKPGRGGLGGGGAGGGAEGTIADPCTDAQPGEDGTGGGGGANGYVAGLAGTSFHGGGANGGSGAVILRYASSAAPQADDSDVEPEPIAEDPGGLAFARVFADHAVLQRGKALKVWGYAPAGTAVTVAFANPAEHRSADATADTDGAWEVTFAALSASAEPGTLKVSDAEGHAKTLSDILVGDVWIADGQSNMDMQLHQARGTTADSCDPAYLALAEDATIRAMRVERTQSSVVAKDLPESYKLGHSWCRVGDRFSAMTAFAFHFARQLRAKGVKVPIGTITTSVGATKVAAHRLNGGCFRAMVAPIVRYGITGVLWFQGESDSGDPDGYADAFAAMVGEWRTAFGQGDFPFYWGQLSYDDALTYDPDDAAAIDRQALLREQQRLAIDKVMNGGMAVSFDISKIHADGKGNVHFDVKAPVGERFAALALADVYGLATVREGPNVDHVESLGTGIRVVYRPSTVGSGLAVMKKAVDNAPPQPSEAALDGFALSEDGVSWTFADAVIDGQDVLVTSAKVASPRYVRYAMMSVPVGHANLYNAEGLPATPFAAQEAEIQVEKPNTVRFLNWDGTLVAQRGLDDGECPRAPFPDPVRKGPGAKTWTFLGWTNVVDGAVLLTSAEIAVTPVAGGVTVAYAAVFEEDEGGDEPVIDPTKDVVMPPVLPSKVYTGERQTAEVIHSDYFTFEENEGGVEVGRYPVVLKLIEPHTHTWPDSPYDTYTVYFSITEAPPTDLTTLPMPDHGDWGYVCSYKRSGKDYAAYVYTNATAQMTFDVPDGVTALDYLVVAGGGSGASRDSAELGGGGGGGGGVLPGNGVPVSAGLSFSVKVGAGANGVTGRSNGKQGGNSSLVCAEASVRAEAIGGGGGGPYQSDGGAGGSGGGGGAQNGGNRRACDGGKGTSGQGHAGGAGWDYASGGGGGAGGPGGDASTLHNGGDGGAGFESAISGTTHYYGAGGAGSGSTKNSVVGENGAAAKDGAGVGEDGADGLGAGGGGQVIASKTAASGAGGSGTVIIRYAVSGGGDPDPEQPTVNGQKVDPEKVFETATSEKPISYPRSPTVSGTDGHQTIAFGGKTVDVPEYYTATPVGNTVTLALNDNAKPKIADGTDGTKAFVVTDTTVSLHLEHTYENLFYARATCAKLDGTWTTGKFEKGKADFTVNRDKSASACFCKIVVSDHE